MDKNLYIKEFTKKIDKHQRIIFKVSGMYCSNPECRKDLFQEILIQLWKSYPNFNHQSKFSSWMYRIALNTAISQFRKDKRAKVDYVPEISESIMNDDLYQEKKEQAKILHQAIGKLNKGEKALIILYMDDYPYEEIAEIIGISVSNVGVKINRIKSKLQKILKELGYGL